MLIRLISLRVAKSTTANPLRSVNCVNIHLVDPSGFQLNVIGRTPRSISSVHAGSSVFVSMTFIVFPWMEPATTYLPSGVTYALWMLPLVGMVFTLLSESVSTTSTPPGCSMIPTYTRRPSLPTAMLLGRPLKGMRSVTLNVLASTTSSVLSASSLT